MADGKKIKDLPKPPMGSMARETVNRPAKLRLKASSGMSPESVAKRKN